MLLSAAAAQQPQSSEAFTLARGTVQFREVIDKAAACLHLQIRCSSQEIGDVMPFELQTAIGTDAAGCEDVVRALLFARNLTLLADPDAKDEFDVVSLRGERAEEVFDRAQVLSAEAVLEHPHRKIAVTTTLALQHENANVLVASLRPLLFPTSKRPGPKLRLRIDNSRSITVTGFQHQIANLILLVRERDQPIAPPADLKMMSEQADKLEKQLASLRSQLAALAAGGGK